MFASSIGITTFLLLIAASVVGAWTVPYLTVPCVSFLVFSIIMLGGIVFSLTSVSCLGLVLNAVMATARQTGQNSGTWSLLLSYFATVSAIGIITMYFISVSCFGLVLDYVKSVPVN